MRALLMCGVACHKKVDDQTTHVCACFPLVRSRQDPVHKSTLSRTAGTQNASMSDSFRQRLCSEQHRLQAFTKDDIEAFGVETRTVVKCPDAIVW